MKAVKIAALLFVIASTSFAGNLGHGISYSVGKPLTMNKTTFVTVTVKNSTKTEYIKVELKITATVNGSKMSKNTSAYYIKGGGSGKTSISLKGMPSNIKVSLVGAYVKDISTVGSIKRTIKHQKIRWFGW